MLVCDDKEKMKPGLADEIYGGINFNNTEKEFKDLASKEPFDNEASKRQMELLNDDFRRYVPVLKVFFAVFVSKYYSSGVNVSSTEPAFLIFM